MIPVALDHAPQRLHASTLGIVGELVPVRDFVPDEDPGFVRRLEIAWVRHLDVATQEVETKRFRLPHFILQILERGRRVTCLGVKGLVKRSAEINHFPVQEKLTAACLERTEAELTV